MKLATGVKCFIHVCAMGGHTWQVSKNLGTTSFFLSDDDSFLAEQESSLFLGLRYVTPVMNSDILFKLTAIFFVM